YAPGGGLNVRQELRDALRFPGMQPVGVYPIHIVVKNGRTMLLGAVGNSSDRQLAEVRAREVTGVFEVENDLTVARYRAFRTELKIPNVIRLRPVHGRHRCVP